MKGPIKKSDFENVRAMILSGQIPRRTCRTFSTGIRNSRCGMSSGSFDRCRRRSSAMLKPICVPCERFMRPDKNGVRFLECMPVRGIAPEDRPVDETRGKRAKPGEWEAYKLWMGDRWRCPDCGATIISGVGLNPYSEHFLPDFDKALVDAVAREGKLLEVKDC